MTKPETRRLAPADGLQVALEPPLSGQVPPGGAELPMTQYYRRLMKAGDLVEVEPRRRPKKDDE